MRARWATLVLATILTFGVPVTSQAKNLTIVGYPLFVYHDMVGDFAWVYVFLANGANCGVARITNISGNTGARMAFETLRNAVMDPPPYNSNAPAGYAYFVPQPAAVGHWVEMHDAASGLCEGPAAPKDILAYTVRY